MTAQTLAPVLIRGASAVAVVLAGWSLNVKWGASSAVRGGPPIQWERMVVAAAMLCAVAAVVLWIATRAPAGARTPARIALRGIATVLAVAAGAIALHLRREAGELGLDRLLSGPGWSWLAAGTLLSFAAAAGSFALRPAPVRPVSKRSSPKR